MTIDQQLEEASKAVLLAEKCLRSFYPDGREMTFEEIEQSGEKWITTLSYADTDGEKVCKFISISKDGQFISVKDWNPFKEE